MRKTAAGYWFCALTIALAAAGLAFYWLNTGTRYFANLGVDGRVPVYTGTAAVLYLLAMVLGKRREGLFTDTLLMAAPVLLMLALAAFASSRINGFASIMTFEYSAQNVADLSSALTGVALYGGAFLLGVLTSFLRVGRDAT